VTARERAVAEASRVFRAGVGYSRLWDALVEALERVENVRDEIGLLESFEGRTAPAVTTIGRRLRSAVS